MFEEQEWGEYKVIDHNEFADGSSSVIKRVTINPGCTINYLNNHKRNNQVLTIIDGTGESVIEGVRKDINKGDTINVASGKSYTVEAITQLTLIEIQSHNNL